MLKEIGERVRKARLAAHMSQAQLAAELDVSVPYISHIEHGKQAMSVMTLKAICDQLEVSADWLLRNNSPQSKQVLAEELAQLLEDCTAAERDAMLKMMKTMKEALRSMAPAQE